MKVEGAFFDVDKTVIAKASMMAFAPSFYREGLIGRRAVLRGLWMQLLYVRFGASPDQLASIRESILSITAGWEQERVREIVADTLDTVIPPITYAEALTLIEEHRQAGRRVYLVSASPADIVEPLARHLGVTGALASVAAVGADGRYTGHIERYAYGAGKADLMRAVAQRDGVELSRSYAYTDSATDVPMLEAVGHPVAVNPDRALRRLAESRGWEVRYFRTPVVPPRRDRRRFPVVAAAIVAPAATLVALGAAWKWYRPRRPGRGSPPSAPGGRRGTQPTAGAAGAGGLSRMAAQAGQLERSFLAAKKPRPIRAARRTIFFMPPP